MTVTGLVIQGREEPVPLKTISVRAFLQGFVVGFRSKFTYENQSSDPLEVIFRTPVDDSYAVVDLEAVIDGRKIRARLQEKAKAKEMYEEAIARGQTAAFGEEKKGDIFSLVLGNLPQGKTAEIHLTMVGELAVEPDGSVRFVLPTVLKPRYTPSGSTDPLEATSSRDEKPTKHAKGPLDYEFDLVISNVDGVAGVTSPSHGLRTRTEGQTMYATVEEDDPKDIVILVRPKEPHKPQVIVEPGLSNGENDFQKSTAIMVSFFPEFKGDISCTQSACEFVFVIDRSGSMRGQYITDASETLLFFLKSIPEGCFFNVIGFGSSYTMLFPESAPYNQENLETAVNHVKKLEADLGGTEIYDPLKYIFGLPQMKGLPRQVFVLTDGSVSNTESVIKLVQQNSHNARCFSFGIGSGASSALVKGIADAGKGSAEFITSGERMQPKVMRSLKKSLQPAVTEAQVKFSLPQGYTVQVAPENIPAVFVGDRTVIYGTLINQSSENEKASSNEGSICLSGELLGGKIEHNMKFQVPVAVPKDNQVITIHHLAAKSLIKDMESRNHRQEKNEQIIKTSCDSNVISSLTGFIAIDVDQQEPVNGSMQIWDVMPSWEFPLMGLGFIPAAPVNCCTSAAPYARSRKSRKSEALSCLPKMPSLSFRSKRQSKGKSESHPQKRLAQSLALTDNLSTIIQLQLANGSWLLTVQLAEVVNKTQDAIKAKCPVPCDGEMEAIWATIISLSYLEQKQADQKEEWELVAGKAEVWLAKQILPEGCSIQSLREKAGDIVN